MITKKNNTIIDNRLLIHIKKACNHCWYNRWYKEKTL